MSIINDFQVNGSNPSRVATNGTGIKYFPRPSASLLPPPGVTTPNATNATGQLVVPGFNELNGSRFGVRLAGTAATVITTNVTFSLFANTGSVTNPLYTALVSAIGSIGSSIGGGITNDALTGGLATYTTSIAHNLNPGQLVTIVATSNGGGIYNVTLQPIFSTPTSTTFTIQINSVPIASAADGGVILVAYPWSLDVSLEGDTLSGITQGYYNMFVNGTRVGSANNALTTNLTPSLGQFAVAIPVNYGAQSPFGLVAAVQFGTGNSLNQASLYQFQIVGD
jgi:hypothetical protein